MADVDFELSKPGLIEVFRSGGMQAALSEVVTRLRDEANTEALSHRDALGIAEFRTAPYMSHVDVLDRTAVGAVSTASPMGRLDNNQFKTLDKLNH